MLSKNRYFFRKVRGGGIANFVKKESIILESKGFPWMDTIALLSFGSTIQNTDLDFTHNKSHITMFAELNTCSES